MFVLSDRHLAHDGRPQAGRPASPAAGSPAFVFFVIFVILVPAVSPFSARAKINPSDRRKFYTNAMQTGAGESSVTSVFVSMPVGRSILNTTVTPLFCPSANT